MTQNNRTKKNKSRQKTRESTFKTRQKIYRDSLQCFIYKLTFIYIHCNDV